MRDDGRGTKMNYEEYERKCEKVKKVNAELLELFADDMEKQNLSEKTINQHVSNVNFYINSYLLQDEALTMDYGVYRVDEFLGNFFIRKCMWSTPATIKSTATGIKKFYKCMLEHGRIRKAGYDFLCSVIKDGMDRWQADCEQFNDPDSENPFAFF